MLGCRSLWRVLNCKVKQVNSKTSVLLITTRHVRPLLRRSLRKARKRLEIPFYLSLLQDFIGHTDRSQSRLELLADARAILSWAGTNVGYPSRANGNAGGAQRRFRGRRWCSTPQRDFSGPPRQNHGYDFITASVLWTLCISLWCTLSIKQSVY